MNTIRHNYNKHNPPDTGNVTTDPHQQNVHSNLHWQKAHAHTHTHTHKHTLMLHTHTHARRLLLASPWRRAGEKHLGYLHFYPMTTVWASDYHNTLMPRCSSANKELHAHWHHPNSITTYTLTHTHKKKQQPKQDTKKFSYRKQAHVGMAPN